MDKDIKIKDSHWRMLWNLKMIKNYKKLDDALCEILQFYENNYKLKNHED